MPKNASLIIGHLQNWVANQHRTEFHDEHHSHEGEFHPTWGGLIALVVIMCLAFVIFYNWTELKDQSKKYCYRRNKAVRRSVPKESQFVRGVDDAADVELADL